MLPRFATWAEIWVLKKKKLLCARVSGDAGGANCHGRAQLAVGLAQRWYRGHMGGLSAPRLRAAAALLVLTACHSLRAPAARSVQLPRQFGRCHRPAARQASSWHRAAAWGGARAPSATTGGRLRTATMTADDNEGEDASLPGGGEDGPGAAGPGAAGRGARRAAVRGGARRLWKRFKGDWRGYCMIPITAAFVGWFTNWLAVKMIFYPLEFRGIPFRVLEDQPFGLFGWRGIVPAKAAKMSGAMVDMVTTSLVDVDTVFRSLDPRRIGELLGPELDKIVPAVAGEVFSAPDSVRSSVAAVGQAITSLTFGAVGVVRAMAQRSFVAGLVRDVSAKVTNVLDVRESVVSTMCADRTLLVELFQTCGRSELRFLTNSGLWVGFMLGLVQMVFWLLYQNPWTLTAGGALVGYLTNWIALKWIFEPVNPVQVGPFVLQGMFLRRQQEVAGEFSNFFSEKVLTSERLWNSILTGPRSGAFAALLQERVQGLLTKSGLAIAAGAGTAKQITDKVLERLPDHVHVLHPYIDETLNLKEKMGEAMNRMTPEQFERVLHPIFEEDELTLIIAGAILGGLAGLLQQVAAQRADRRRELLAGNADELPEGQAAADAAAPGKPAGGPLRRLLGGAKRLFFRR